MKLNDVKHNHSLTDLLKILIFSILMMIPFIDVGIRCAYVVCNKNAYQSYYGETINEKQYTSITNLETYTEYEFVSDTYTTDTQYYLDYNLISINNTDLPDYILNTLQTCNRVYFRTTSSDFVFYENGQYKTEFSAPALYLQMKIEVLGYNGTLAFYQQVLKNIEYNKFSYLDNVFNYSVNKLTTSELYTWTQQTAIYTGVQTMCAQLGINNTVIPLLLVYWFILTVIYIIIDIVLKLFTMLTHAIGSKTA